MVAVDNTLLCLMLHTSARPPRDPATGKPVDRVQDRIEKLLEDLDADSERMIIPTPALCEFLILADKDGPEYLEKIRASRTLIITPFDEMAAIELAAIEREARGSGDKRGGSSATWAKVRFDRQIVAIAKAHKATRIYSDDEDVVKFGTKAGLEVVSTWSLGLPAAKQTKMFDDEGTSRFINLDDEE